MPGKYFDVTTIEITNMEQINRLAYMLENPRVFSKEELKEIME